ncbi:hypothetical protein SDC9_103065 [bioreactor metagenome]|uniref:Polymerase/histidinol phosphatase N-terminal domain-containing protein n=1 Tax=bioreactor metagenome TaxID=1076179 RepID=A0A645AZE0_9ZZZZ
MTKNAAYFDVAPLVVKADSRRIIRIRPRFEHAALPAADEMRIRVIPAMGAMPDGRQVGYIWEPGENTPAPVGWKRTADGALEVEADFRGEQEHLIFLEKKDGTPIREFSVYSLKPDLYELRPVKGDFHIHTTGSDGQECPEYVAARYRQEGFDFIAITDHYHYEPSMKAVDYWKPYRTGLKLYPGEEVHPPDCPVHMVNFGGAFSVNEFFRSHEPCFRGEVKARIPALGTVVPGVSPFAVAATEWTFDKIREAGGLAVFCHPYWNVRGWNVIPEALADEVFRRRRFDAFEMVGGFWKHQSESNQLQIVRCYEEWRKNGPFPVVGLSDSHGTDREGLFSWYYTLVFAGSDRLPDLAGAIRDGRSVAVDAPSGERAHCHGDFRLVKYAQFLIREYFPRHGRLCRTEGDAMLDILGGEKEPAGLPPISGERVIAFRDSVFQ